MKEPTENHHPALQLYFLATLASFDGKVRSQPGFQQQVALKKPPAETQLEFEQVEQLKTDTFPHVMVEKDKNNSK